MIEDSELNGDAVRVHLASMKFEYEITFSTPSFGLTARRPELLRALYEGLYSFDVEDVQVSDGSRLSDGRISIGLFDGIAAIEVTAKELRLVFNNLPDWDSLSFCKECIASATKVIVDAIPESAKGMVAIDVTLHLNSGNVEPARRLLNRVARTDPFDFSDFGDVSQYHDVKFEIENEEDKWMTFFRTSEDISDESLLSLSCYTLYGEDGSIRGLEAQIGHVDKMIRTLLPQIGMSLQ